MPFENWKAKLRGEKVISYTDPTENDEGYYRIKITEKAPNGSGRNILKGYTPICYFLYDGKLTGNIGDGDGGYRPMTDDEVIAKWTYCCANAIPYQWYQAVAERGEAWPDFAEKLVMSDAKTATDIGNAIPAVLDEDGGLVPAADRAVRLSDNQPPKPPVVEEEPHVIAAREIDAAIAAAITTITNDDEAAIALGNKNRIGELRLKATKAGKALYEPPRKEYERILAFWNPIVKRAKLAEDRIWASYLRHQDDKRRKAEQEAAAERKRLAEIEEAERKRLEEEAEANARAADRAIAAGLPEPEPEVAEPEPVPERREPTTTYAPVAAAYGSGRRPKEEVKVHVDTVTDWSALATYFCGNADVQALLLKLATTDIRAGRTVPGITTRTGLI